MPGPIAALNDPRKCEHVVYSAAFTDTPIIDTSTRSKPELGQVTAGGGSVLPMLRASPETRSVGNGAHPSFGCLQ